MHLLAWDSWCGVKEIGCYYGAVAQVNNRMKNTHNCNENYGTSALDKNWKQIESTHVRLETKPPQEPFKEFYKDIREQFNHSLGPWDDSWIVAETYAPL